MIVEVLVHLLKITLLILCLLTGAKKVAALTPEPDDVILEQQQTPQQQVPQFKPGLRLHNAKNTGFSIFRR